MTTADFNQRIERRRADQASLGQVQGYAAQDAQLRATAESEKRVDALRQAKAAQTAQQARYADALLEQELQRRSTADTTAAEEAALAKAIRDLEISETAKQRITQRVVEESPELQELKKLLAAAQTNKIRQTQLAEKEVIAAQDSMQRRLHDAKMEADRQEALAVQHEMAMQQQQRNVEQRVALQGQIKERLDRRAAAAEQDAKERAIVDGIVRGIQEEDQAKAEAGAARRRQLQDEIAAYLQQREAWRQQERARASEELRRIQEYNAQQEARLAELSSKKAVQSQQQDLVLRKLTEEIQRKRKEQEEVEALLQELYWEEAEQKALDEVRMREEKARAMKQQIIQTNEFQKQLKAQREVEIQREEQAFRQQMMERFAADRRIEQLNAQRRRVETEQYRREVDGLVAERKRLQQEALARELGEIESARREEEDRLKIVEAERQRLLREHAAALADYLPKGVLQSADDYRLLFGKDPAPGLSFGIKRKDQLQNFDYDFR
mgnify:CR=1 FL=1